TRTLKQEIHIVPSSEASDVERTSKPMQDIGRDRGLSFRAKHVSLSAMSSDAVILIPSTSPQTQPPRHSFPRYPTGWFQVAYSDEIKPGEVKPLVYFGKQLVTFRTASGRLSVLDAVCPHMRAHIGLGGKVK